jgi:two-component system CheB/CheR fusion protein
MISCRNVLIYLEPVLQRRVAAAFHYALNTEGVLLLGKSESLTAFPELFAAMQRKSRFFKKRATANNPQFRAAAETVDRVALREKVSKPVKPVVDLQREADRIVWSRYAHAGIIVDDNLHILHFRGDTSPYLSPVAGAASLHLLKMIKGSLLVDLRAAFRQAKKENAPVRREGIRMTFAGQSREISLDVVPLASLDAPERQFLILLEEMPRPVSDSAPAGKTTPQKEDIPETLRLEQELLATREYLQAIIEEQETTNEELKASNEEALSNNEELQSTNEELETAKEELQSTNEELVTLTEQQTSRNTELSHLNDDLRNVLEGIEIPVLMLDNDRRVRRFTPTAETLFNLLPSDVGRPIQNLRPNLDLSDLGPVIVKATDSLSPHQQQVTDLDGRRYLMTVRPYRTANNQIDGVLIAMEDVDELTRTLDEARRARDLANAIVETAREILVVLDSGLRVVTANRAFYDLFDGSVANAGDQSIFDLGGGDFDNPQLRELLEQILPSKTQFTDFRLIHDFPQAGRRILLLNGRRLESGSDESGMILLAMEDVTAEETAAEALQQNQDRLRDLATGLLTAQEEERRRISRELHDDLNQRLAMLTVELETLEKGPLSSNDLTRSRLAALRTRTEAISDDVRRTAHQLHPSMVEHLGLPAALRSLCDDVSKQERFRVTCRVRNVSVPISAEIALCLYRVAQEALRNVATHSGAQRATLSLALVRGRIRLAIVDNGQGFERDASPTVRKGLGILSMEERVRLVGGSLKLDSKPGEGTRVVVEVPMPKGDS